MRLSNRTLKGFFSYLKENELIGFSSDINNAKNNTELHSNLIWLFAILKASEDGAIDVNINQNDDLALKFLDLGTKAELAKRKGIINDYIVNATTYKVNLVN